MIILLLNDMLYEILIYIYKNDYFRKISLANGEWKINSKDNTENDKRKYKNVTMKSVMLNQALNCMFNLCLIDTKYL